MSELLPSLRSTGPFAWAFHRASSRWAFNMLSTDVDDTPEPGKEWLELEYRPLPSPEPAPSGLEEAIRSRRSCRQFSASPISQESLSAVLANCLGAHDRQLVGNLELVRRPCPSPGGLYPLEAYVIGRRIEGIHPGIYHYQAQTHSLGQVRDGVPPEALETYLFMGQPYAAQGAATLVISCVFARSLKKYRDRGYRYALIEAGHVGQNAVLTCAALGLGCCPIGGFFDSELGQLLKLDPEHEAPLYALTIGCQSKGTFNSA